MSEVVLYDYWRSSASYRVRLALELLGIAYRKVPVDLLEAEQRSPKHLARNPQGLVPVLDIDGVRLTQSLAIIEYLAEKYPHFGLLPADAVGRARVRALSYAIAMETHPVCNLRVVAKAVEFAADRETARAVWMRHFIADGLAAFEGLLDNPSTGSFCHGDRPTMADLCLVPQIYNADRWGVDKAPYPHIRSIYGACERQPFLLKAFPTKPSS